MNFGHNSCLIVNKMHNQQSLAPHLIDRGEKLAEGMPSQLK